MSYRDKISSRRYFRLKGTCSLASRALLNIGDILNNSLNKCQSFENSAKASRATQNSLASHMVPACLRPLVYTVRITSASSRNSSLWARCRHHLIWFNRAFTCVLTVTGYGRSIAQSILQDFFHRMRSSFNQLKQSCH